MSADFPAFTKTFHTLVYPTTDPTNGSLSAYGKIVLITGGSKGIGKAIGEAFALARARAIVILGRTASTLEAATAEISNTAKKARNDIQIRSFDCDVCDSDAIVGCFKKVRDEIGFLDIVVHNAGDIFLSPIAESNICQYSSCFETNVKRMLTCMQAFARFGQNSTATTPATFINVSTIGIAMAAMPGWSAYVASKLAAWKIAEPFSIEVGDRVRVLSIHLGRIGTEMTEKAGIPTFDDPVFPGAFCVWLAATPEADFLRGRLVACNWDIGELLRQREEIVGNRLLLVELTGL